MKNLVRIVATLLVLLQHWAVGQQSGDWSFQPRSATSRPFDPRSAPRQNDFRYSNSPTQTFTRTTPPPSQEAEDTAAATKEQIDSFLTRQSRNSFVGM